MACAKTLTTPTGGGFVFQPAEPRRRFPNRFMCIGWLVYSGYSNRCWNNTTLGSLAMRSVSGSMPDDTRMESSPADDGEPSARVGMKRLFRSGR
jgi:hypothetical protein